MILLRRLLSFKRLLPVLIGGSALLFSGCASMHQMTCPEFEKNRREADYGTRYRFMESDSETAADNFKPLPRGKTAAVRLYKMRVGTTRIRPCNHLTLYKEIYLQRRVGVHLKIEEVREFYTADGALIARKVETIGDQLRTSGYYSGDMVLPVPEHAPLGKYRIVSKLVMKEKNRTRTTVLSKTSVNFEVIAPR